MLEKLIYYLKRLGIFLITVALIVGMVGCGGGAPSPKKELINNWYDLNRIRNNLLGNYQLVDNIDSHSDGYAQLVHPDGTDGKGWLPIGSEFGPFRGSFDGNGYEVRDLFIEDHDQSHVGLFGYVARGGVVEDISVVDIAVTGKEFVGGLVGRNDGVVSISRSTGNVTGERVVGGLVGWNDRGTVSISHSTASVTGEEHVGGLMGSNDRGNVENSYSTGSVIGKEMMTGEEGGRYVGGLVGYNKGEVSSSHSTGTVTGEEHVGGLVGYLEGYMDKGTVRGAYSTATVTGNDYVGGLVGYNNKGEVSGSFWNKEPSRGSVDGEEYVGGLVGYNDKGTVENSYSTGSVTGEEGGRYVGGLVGHNSGGAVRKSYSNASVDGEEYVGGLVGENRVGGTVSDSFWDTETSETEESEGGTGKTTAEMQDLDTFADKVTEGLDDEWEIVGVSANETDDTRIWNIIDDKNYPFLSWEPVD